MGRRLSLPIIHGTSSMRALKLAILAATVVLIIFQLFGFGCTDGSSFDDVTFYDSIYPLDSNSLTIAETTNLSDTNLTVCSFAKTSFVLPFTEETNCEMIHDFAASLSETRNIPLDDASCQEELQGWEDAWIAHGLYSPTSNISLTTEKVDIVITWTNGTDEDFVKLKSPYEHQSSLNSGDWVNALRNRYRDWNELKYAVRSIFMNFPAETLGRVYLITKDLGDGKVQLPAWLNPSFVTLPPSYMLPLVDTDEDDSLSTENQTSSPSLSSSNEDYMTISIVPDELLYPQNQTACLPTFNSISVESGIQNIPGLSNRFLTLSDDMSLGRSISASDIQTPLFGTPISLYLDMWKLNVDQRPEFKLGKTGEAPVAEFTSYLLNLRFGERERALQLHQPKTMDKRMMTEAMSSFPRAGIENPTYRFRGEGEQLYPWYLTSHYIIERHRESLLWSYISLKSDLDGDGYLNLEERRAIIRELQYGRLMKGYRSHTSALDSIQTTLDLAGLPKLNMQRPVWSSMDGPLHLSLLSADDCSATFLASECFAPGFESLPDSDSPMSDTEQFAVPHILQHFGVNKPKCGDCLIRNILNTSAQGLNPLLPAPTSPLLRLRAIKAIYRYKYLITIPDAEFLMLFHPFFAKDQFKQVTDRIDTERGLPAYLCVNDDVRELKDDEMETMKSILHEFYDRLFPIRMPFEL